MGVKIINGKVHLFDLDGKWIYVGISNELVNRITEKIKALKLDMDIFGKRFIYRLKTYRRISLSLLKEISSELNISHEYIEKNVTLITSCRSTGVGIKNPKLPFDFLTKEGMIMIASIFGDGGISKGGNVRYHNQDRVLIDIFIKSLDIMGDVGFKIYFRKDKTYHVSLPIIAGYVLSALGIEWGYKTKTNPHIPVFVLKSDVKMKAFFIRHFSNDEGNVRLKDRRIQLKQTIETEYVPKAEMRKNPSTYAPRCLLGIKKMLLDLNIVSKVSLGDFRKETSVKTDWELSIYGRENLEEFSKLIGFDSRHKREYLDECLKSYRCPSSGRNERILFALQYAAKTEMENGFITKHLLAKHSRRKLKTSTYFLVDLKKTGLVKVTERPRKPSGHQLPIRYKITRAGWNYLKSRKDRVFIEDVRRRL
jgi:hypothetical protein